MNGKFWREARDIVDIFFKENDIDPIIARSHLAEKLKNKRKKIVDQVYELISRRSIDD